MGGGASAPHLKEYFAEKQKFHDGNPVEEMCIALMMCSSDVDAVAVRGEEEKWYAEAGKTILENSFGHHDKDKSKKLNKSEAERFFANLIQEEDTFMATMSEAGIRASLQATIRFIKAGASMKDGSDVKKKEEELCQQCKNAVAAAKQDAAQRRKNYKAQKKDFDEAAFRLMDANGDGSIVLDEFLAFFDPASAKHDELLVALGFMTEQEQQQKSMVQMSVEVGTGDSEIEMACSQGLTEMPSDPCQWGMTVQQLYELGVEVFGSPQAILEACSWAMQHALAGRNMRELEGPQGMAMYDLCTEVVKPKTKSSNLSLAVLMNKSKPKVAEVFISHCWAEKFCYFVTLLCFSCFPEEAWHVKGPFANFKEAFKLITDVKPLPGDCVLWICLFAINQNAHIGEQLGGDVMNSPFARAMRESTKVIVVYNLSLDIYTRVWCVLEAYIAVNTQKQQTAFKIVPMGVPPQTAMQPLLEHCGDRINEWRQFWKNPQQGGRPTDLELAELREACRPTVLEFVEAHSLSVLDAQTSVESDRIMIMKAVHDKVDKLNDLVKEMRVEMLLNAIPIYVFR